jgi:4-hydroxymandelate oxidase
MHVPSEPHGLDDILNLHDFEPVARSRLDPGVYAYYATGAADEATTSENVAAWGRWHFVPRVLQGVAKAETTSAFFGSEVRAPIGIAPIALQGLAHPDGELATARAAQASRIPYILSTASTRSIEEVAEVSSGLKWFQLYVEHDLGYARELVHRAEEAGYGAIVLTVDLPVIGPRERDRRARFNVGAGIQAHLPPEAGGNFGDFIQRKSVALDWDDVATIAGWTSLPLVLKGILSADDARRSITAGAAGLIVSNHGGRQLDHSAPASEVLAGIVDMVGGLIEVYADGGIRRGTDVAAALAMGATGVFVGRPIIYALATAGEAGVTHALDILIDEFARTLVLLGCARVVELDRSLIQRSEI